MDISLPALTGQILVGLINGSALAMLSLLQERSGASR